MALRMVRYSDERNLLSAWSREMGRISLWVPAGSSAASRRRRAMAMPLAAFEGQCEPRVGQTVLNLRAVAPSAGSMAFAYDPAKNMTAIFLAEFLDLALRRQERDDVLSDYLFRSVETLATLSNPTALANFHLTFLAGLTGPLGIMPDLSDPGAGTIFDLRDGRLRHSPPLHHDWLTESDTLAAKTILRLRYRNMHLWKASRQERNRVLDTILQYYSIHLAPTAALKSLDILRQL